MASDAFSRVGTAEEMAKWYAKNIRKEGFQEHAKGMMAGVLGEKRVLREVEEGGKKEEVKQEVLSKLPGNLVLDMKTWKEPVKGSVRRKGRGM